MADPANRPVHQSIEAGRTTTDNAESLQKTLYTSASQAAAHPLLLDAWAVEDEAEFGIVRLSRIAVIERNAAAISAMARLLGNNCSESASTGNAPFDSWTIASLAAGIESICGFTLIQTEEMRIEADMRSQ